MKYDFTTVIDRHGKDSLALDGLGGGDHFSPDWSKEGFDVIPMWVADMNFPTVPTIQEAIIMNGQSIRCLDIIARQKNITGQLSTGREHATV